MPENTPHKYKEIKIKKFCAVFLLNLKSTTSPTPAPVQSPPISAPSVILPAIKHCVRITDAAQFGISPTSAVKNGWRTVCVLKKSKTLSPTAFSITNSSASDTKNMKTKIFAE